MDVDIKSCVSVHKVLTDAGIEPIDGKAYTLYECGHVFNVEDDPAYVRWYASVGRALRSCPLCDKQRLLTKYKKCGCGEEQVGPKVQPSRCCTLCPPDRKVVTVSPYAYRKNGHLVDINRGFCIHKNGCLTKFIDYVTVPCKGCLDYLVEQGAHDPLSEIITG
jgi:hypothetical protein